MKKSASKKPIRRRNLKAGPVSPTRGTARTPCRARGQRRVDAILDAARDILLEDGPEALSFESIATRSATSKSSMYHFFSDLESVINALAERHICSFQALEEAKPSGDIDWGALEPHEVVDEYLAPVQTYLSEHPDMLAVMQLGGHRAKDAAHANGIHLAQVNHAESILAARFKGVRPAVRRARAATIVGSLIGSLESSARMPDVVRTLMMRELRAVLIAYFTDIDARTLRR